MPITRRRRANPPDQPEHNNDNHQSEQTENTAEAQATERTDDATTETEKPATHSPVSPAAPARVENGNYQTFTPPPSTLPNLAAANTYIAPAPLSPAGPNTNGERDYTPGIEGGRRTARGELFRRPPQPPTPPPAPPSATLQPPSHEISLPLGNLLHLAYNPGYTGSDEARSALLQQLANESKAGGRARCWNCGSLAIAYDRWNTRSRTFGEVGIAFCEICGVWSVM